MDAVDTAGGGRTIVLDLHKAVRDAWPDLILSTLVVAHDEARVRSIVIAVPPVSTHVSAQPAAVSALLLRELCLAITRFPRAVIAAVDGVQGVWGLGICAAADLVVAGRTASFASDPTTDESIDDLLLTYLPVRWAKWLALGAGALTAAEGQTFGFVNLLAEEGRSLAAAVEFAERVGHVPADILAIKKTANNFRLALPER